MRRAQHQRRRDPGEVLDERADQLVVAGQLVGEGRELVDGVELYEERKPLFEKWGIDKEIESTLGKRVDLASGGYLIIDYAEALTVIDINSGSFTGRGKSARLEDVITKTNLEAAEEVVNQLRLRDIGGIIVIDFIDMEIRENRHAVIAAFRDALARDKTRTQVFDISDLGLVEMTRKRIGEGLLESFSGLCPECEGRGVVIDQSLLD